MKHLFFLLLLIGSTTILFAQNDTFATDSCLHFEDYNFCYSADYRGEENKVGLICDITDFMVNPNVEVVSYNVYLLINGQLMPSYKRTGKDFIKQLAPYLEEKFSFTLEIKVKLDNQIIRYPTIEITNCK